LEGCRGDSLEAWRAAQPGLERLVGWSCAQDCAYSCMWTTVQVYGEKGRWVNTPRRGHKIYNAGGKQIKSLVMQR